MKNKTVGEIKINNINFWERFRKYKNKKSFNYWKVLKNFCFIFKGLKFEFKISSLEANRNIKNIKKWK